MNAIALINTRAEVEGKTEVPGAAFAHPTRQNARDVRATTTGSSGSRRHDYERRQGSGKSCRHRTNEAQVVRVQQVDRSTLGSGHSVPIGSIDDDCWPALTSTIAAGEGSRGNRKPPRCQQGMTPATGFPCPRLPSPGDRRHPIDHSVPFEDPKRVTKGEFNGAVSAANSHEP